MRRTGKNVTVNRIQHSVISEAEDCRCERIAVENPNSGSGTNRILISGCWSVALPKHFRRLFWNRRGQKDRGQLRQITLVAGPRNEPVSNRPKNIRYLDKRRSGGCDRL